ncbi:MAG: response regulator [Candidatus Omnitrophica bacterium]|nr:response regulator [Candidatus Omnitrophota bacterium]
MKKILIVDDEVDVTDIMKETIEMADDYQVDIAEDGQKALAALMAGEYHVMMTDMQLPGGMSGVDVIKECAKFEKRPKIMVVSGAPRNQLSAMLEDEGVLKFVDRILEKPADLIPNTLLTILKNAVG